MIILPTRGRPKEFARFVKSYTDTESTAPVIVMVDKDDPTLSDYQLFNLPPAMHVVVNAVRKKCPEACTWLFDNFPNEPYYCLLGDDIILKTKHWDKRLIEAAGRNKVAYGNDMCYQKPSHPIVGGDLVRAVGWFGFPHSLHWYMDTAWEWLAQKTDRLVYIPDIITEHRHVDLGTAPNDTTYKERWLDLKTNKILDRDVDHAAWDMWHRRGEADVAVQAILRKCPLTATYTRPGLQPSDFIAYMQVNKDDFFLFEVCKRLFEEGIRKFYFHVPRYKWTGEAVTDSNLRELMAISNQVFKLGAQTTLEVCELQKVPHEARVDMETRVRQEAISKIRSLGHKHILIVDGDELWKHGALTKVIDKIATGSTCVSLRMTSVIGSPGYPVAGGKDDAIVYLGDNRTVSVCRYPDRKGQFDKAEGGELIFHFTGVRRTDADIVAKMRASGHYDDKRYHFESWVDQVLPYIKPGMQRVHMFQDGSVWPSVREWSKEELAQIPDCYYPYLAV